MTKQEIIKLIDDCKPSKEIREMVIGSVNLAYDSGFQAGIKLANEQYLAISNMLDSLKGGNQ